MDAFINVIHNTLRLFIVVILPCGLLAGGIGVWLRKKYEDHPKENLIVTGGMLLATIAFVTAFFVAISLIT